MSTLAFELVSPERLLVSRAIEMVTIPGEEGDFGVLAGHAPMVSTLRAGVVLIKGTEGDVEPYFVAGGFAEVSPERCAVLAEEAVALADLNAAALDADAQKTRDAIATADDAQKVLLSRALSVIEAKRAAIAA